jgi:hypothetical protein
MAIAQIDVIPSEKLLRSRARGFAEQTRAALKLVPDLTVDNSDAVALLSDF